MFISRVRYNSFVRESICANETSKVRERERKKIDTKEMDLRVRERDAWSRHALVNKEHLEAHNKARPFRSSIALSDILTH